MTTATQSRPPDARAKLLDAAVKVIRKQGFTATSVDDLCKAASVTKGAFFHHFESKEALGVAAANYWSATTSALFESAPFHAPRDPLDRVLAYVDFRIGLLNGPVADVTCLVGTMVQEVYESSPHIAEACDASISGHARTLEADIKSAMQLYKVKGNWSAASLAIHTQAVLQGAFILAKAKGDTAIAIDTARHLRRYIELLFATKGSKA